MWPQAIRDLMVLCWKAWRSPGQRGRNLEVRTLCPLSAERLLGEKGIKKPGPLHLASHSIQYLPGLLPQNLLS